jgi:hypothetical protein
MSDEINEERKTHFKRSIFGTIDMSTSNFYENGYLKIQIIDTGKAFMLRFLNRDWN